MIQLFFGSKDYAYNIKKTKKILCSEYVKDLQLSFLQKEMNVTYVMILKQVHGADGLTIKENNFVYHCKRSALVQEKLETISLRSLEGDFLITNKKKVGLGLLTADCLPVIFYDPDKHVVAAAHAGWRGSVLGICKKVLQNMQLTFGSDVKNIQVFFGPAAKVCCYEVSEQFYNNALNDTLFEKSIIKKYEKLFFDNGYYTTQQLLECGVLQNNICYNQYFCTMCSSLFCSYRQDGGAQTRNITVVSLK